MGRDASSGEVWLYDPDLVQVKTWKVADLECLEHGRAKDGLKASSGGTKHGIIVPVPVSMMEKAGTYYFVLHFLDNHPDKYKDHRIKPALEINATHNPTIDAVSLHYHPAPDHGAHYDRHKYPLSDRLTMLRAVVQEAKKWFSRSSYVQQSADDCWWPPLPAPRTSRWISKLPTFRWFLIMPNVELIYERADQVRYLEEKISDWTGWGPTRKFEPGTRRYRVEVTYQGRTVSSPGAREALRMSVRDARYTNPIAQWATAWLNVPFILGSLPCPYAIENFEGIDCADLLIAAHNKGHRDRIRQGLCNYIDPCTTTADMLAKSDKMTEPVIEPAQGDLIFWDMHGPGEVGDPDGVYDHSMIYLEGEDIAIWASVGWDPESGTTPETARFTKRCVVIGSWKKWRDMVQNVYHYNPRPPLWRRFR